MLHRLSVLILTAFVACFPITAGTKGYLPRGVDMVALAAPASAPTTDEPLTISVYRAPPADTPMITLSTFEDADTKAFILALDELDGKTPQVWIRIDTQGGNVANGMKIIRALEIMNSAIICVVDFRAYSMGFDVLQSMGCDLRLSTPRGSLMWHAPRIDPDDSATASKLRDMAEQVDAINEGFLWAAALRMHGGYKVLADKIDRHDWWMSWKEALRWGAVDGLIDPKNLPKNLPKVLWMPVATKKP